MIPDTFDSRFVGGWRRCLRWASVQMHVIGTSALLLLALVPSLPSDVAAVVPERFRVAVVAVWGIAGLYARLKKQGKPHG